MVRMSRRELLIGGCAVGVAGLVGAVVGVGGGIEGPPTPALPLALVYRGPASSSGCPEAVARVLASGPSPFRVEYVGPDEQRPLSREGLAGAALYAQPGGGTVERAWRRIGPSAPVIREYTLGGGAYLGFCLGAYLAGRSSGFALFDGDTDEYVGSPGASVDTTDDTVITVRWRGVPRQMYFQDGPIMKFSPTGVATAQVLATYDGGAPAAVVAPAGRGRVGLVGPHPEAPPSWYASAGLPDADPDGQTGLARDLVVTTLAMRPGAPS